MTARKPKHLHKPDGRPSPYKKEYDHQAEVACSEGGFTDKKLAALFSVCKATITNWKRDHPTFLASIKKGKDEFNIATAEDSLLKRIKGFSYNEVTKEPVIVEGCVLDKKLTTTKSVRKHVAPDPTSIIFFLKNRDRERWQDRKRIDHGITKDLAEHTTKLAEARARKQKK